MKKVKYLLPTLFAALFFLLFTGSVSVNATAPATVTPPAQVTGLKQKDASSSSIMVEWTAQLATDIDYHVQISQDGKAWVDRGDTYGRSNESLYDLNAGSTYYVRVCAYVEDENYNPVYGPYSAPLECITEPGNRPEYLKKINSTTNSITLEWGAVAGANVYQVSYYPNNADAKTAKIVYTDKNTITLENLEKDGLYNVEVEGLRKNSTGTFQTQPGYLTKSEYSLGVTPQKVTGGILKYYWGSSSEVVLSCNPLNSADGYEAEVWTAYKKKDSRLAVGESLGSSSIYVKHTSFKKKNFLKGRIRAYTTTGDGVKVYGEWSDWLHFSDACDVKDLTVKKKGITVIWGKVNGADRYTIYASDKQKGKYKKVASTKKTKYVVKKFNKKALKKKKTYYFYVVAENKVGKKYYPSILPTFVKYIKNIY